ncbi:MAG: CDP-diacylglycerol--glycerol-3-phosphate 3-phosphatidyltransferase [bacterium]
MKLNIPIYITLLRIALIPAFVIVFMLPYFWAALASTLIFSVASITDWLDGYLARKLGQESRFGAFLDPVADKLMVSTALVMIVMHHSTPEFAIASAVIIGREITITALREWMAVIGETGKVKVAMIGKIKTTAQISSIILLLLDGPIPFLGWNSVPIGAWLLYAAAVLTIWSAVTYLRCAWPIMKEDSYKN